MSNKINYTYDEIHELIKQGSKKVIDSVFKPDLILAIGGGGFIPARILRNYINIPIISLTINFYDQNNNIKNEPNIIQMVDKSLVENKNILIVDEIDDTRKTLGFIIDYFNMNDYNLNSIGIFVVNNKIKNKTYEIPLNCFYFSCENNLDNWIIYPWDKV